MSIAVLQPSTSLLRSNCCSSRRAYGLQVRIHINSWRPICPNRGAQVYALGSYQARIQLETQKSEEEEEEEDSDVDSYKEEEEQEEEDDNDAVGRDYEQEEERLSGGSVDFTSAQELLESIAALKDEQTVRIHKMVKGWLRTRDFSVPKCEFVYIMRRLRKRKRCRHALQIADWMALTTPKPYSLNTRDKIFRIDLASRCRALKKAERIFQLLQPEDRSEVAYNALLLGYAKNRRLASAQTHFNQLKDSCKISSPYSFNLMASLYRELGMHDKVLLLQHEAQELDVKLDICFCNNLLDAKYRVQGLGEAERFYSSMSGMLESSRKPFFTYVIMARCYTSAGRKEEANRMLEMIEQGMETGKIIKQRRRYNMLISMYSLLGNTLAMERVWDKLRQTKTLISEDYCCMIKSWGKVGQLEKAEMLFKEAEAAEKQLKYSDIFNSMMFVYSLMGMKEEAEALALRMEYDMGIQLDTWCYHHLILLYAREKDLDKMLSTLQAVQAVSKRHRRFYPLPASLWIAMDTLAEFGDVETAGHVLRKWKSSGYRINGSIYNRLLKAHLVAGKPAVGFVEQMLADGIRPNAQTEELFNELKVKLASCNSN